jgi:hypothetical protein
MRKLIVLPFILMSLSVYSQSNYALNFNGTNQYVSIGAPIASNSSYTKEAWILVTTLSGTRHIISSLNHPFWINGGILSAGQAGGYSRVTDPASLSLNSWVHVAVTYDAATTTMRLYRNGVLISTNTSVPAYTNENEFIGSHAGTASYIQGMADEVRIWNTALTAAQLKKNMYKGPANNESGLVAYYKCNDGSGSLLTNATGGSNGTLENSPTWVASPVQFSANALQFDGVNDVVTIPDNNSLDITSAITLEAWVYATKNSGVQNVISKSSNAVNNGYIFPRTDNGWTNAVFYLHVSGGWRTLSAPYPSLNAWHHLAATYDGVTMRLYIDGVQAATKAQTGTITINGNALALGNQIGFTEYFGGTADEFRIWNVARTQAQIQAGMNIELDPAAQTGLVSYYTVNQGIAAGTNTGIATEIDQTGNNNGTLANFTLSGASSNFVAQNSSLVVLPLQWLSFIAQQQTDDVLLKWSTAREENTSDFVLQHSSNGVAWNEIGSIAAGSSHTINNYSYTHTNTVIGINYYRILQRDIDGRSSYSDIRSVRLKLQGRMFSVVNNPVENGVLQVKLMKTASSRLYSSDGKLVWQGQMKAGINNIPVDRYVKGVYLMKVEGETERIIVK